MVSGVQLDGLAERQRALRAGDGRAGDAARWPHRGVRELFGPDPEKVPRRGAERPEAARPAGAAPRRQGLLGCCVSAAWAGAAGGDLGPEAEPDGRDQRPGPRGAARPRAGRPAASAQARGRRRALFVPWPAGRPGSSAWVRAQRAGGTAHMVVSTATAPMRDRNSGARRAAGLSPVTASKRGPAVTFLELEESQVGPRSA